jgi:hypothetical protein
MLRGVTYSLACLNGNSPLFSASHFKNGREEVVVVVGGERGGGSLAHGVMVIQEEEASSKNIANRAACGPTTVGMWRLS